MSEDEKCKDKEASFKDNQTIVTLLKEIVLKLEAMERKVEILTRESKQKSFRDKPFSRPRGEYDKPRHHKGRAYEGKKDAPSSEGKFYHGLPFAKKTAAKGRYAGVKKPYSKTGK